MEKSTMLCLLLCVFPPSVVSLVNPSNVSTLDLEAGLHISVLDVANSVPAILGYNGSYFLPILSTPSFNSSKFFNSSGFSLGFLYKGNSSTAGRDIYLVVCGGVSGSIENVSSHEDSLFGWADNVPIQPRVARYGYVVPTWYANVTALKSYYASLRVVEDVQPTTGTRSNQLQLVDYDGTIFWSVSNVEAMDLSDTTGVLSIYNTTDKTYVAWQTSTNTLLKGQKLMVGSQLQSQEGTYLARMEEGGLVLYSYALHFMKHWPTPYWAIPAFLEKGDNMLDVENQILSIPCGPNLAYTEITSDCNVWIVSGPCNNMSVIVSHNENPSCGALSFMQLEDDGRLVMYALPDAMEGDDDGTTTLFTQTLTLWDGYYPSNGESGDAIMSNFGSCTVPDACGLLGLCAAFANNPCTCPPSLVDEVDAFTAIEPNDPDRGCMRTTELPACITDEHVATTDFLELQHTATILLFSGWDFAPTSGQNTESCEQSCLHNCSCIGLVYVVDTSSCFFFTDEMTLVNVTDHGLPDDPSYINGSNYVTYLKKTKDAPGKSKLIVIIAVPSIAVICMGIGLIVHVLLARSRARMREKERLEAQQEEEALREVLPMLPTRFTFEELQHATEGFSKLLGAGGFGSVYAGMLRDGRKIAVKNLELFMKGRSRDFLAEVATIGQTNHQSIVRLVGFCWEVSKRLLVYEYMERGSLDQWLFKKAGTLRHDGSGAPLVLDWNTRYNIVLGIIRGLCYLHEECSQPILHFDIKPENILLDGKFGAKLADFGMSKLWQRDATEVVTGVRGTPGYIAPEWLSHGAVSKKSDVYSLGMVMLEIVGGRKNVNLQLLKVESYDVGGGSGGGGGGGSGIGGREEDDDEDAWYFPRWAARKCEKGLLKDIIDERLQGLFNEEEARRLIYTAFWCIQQDPGKRPYAHTVQQWLEGSSRVKEPPFELAVRSEFRCTPSIMSPYNMTTSLLDSSQRSCGSFGAFAA